MGYCDFASVIINPKGCQDIPCFPPHKPPLPKKDDVLSEELFSDGKLIEPEYKKAGYSSAFLEIFIFDKKSNPSSVDELKKIIKEKKLKPMLIECRYSSMSWDFFDIKAPKSTYSSDPDYKEGLGYREILSYELRPIWEFLPSEECSKTFSETSLYSKYAKMYKEGKRMWIKNYTRNSYLLYKNGGMLDIISDEELAYVCIQHGIHVKPTDTRKVIFDRIVEKVGA